jgi:hypothetical protein
MTDAGVCFAGWTRGARPARRQVHELCDGYPEAVAAPSCARRSVAAVSVAAQHRAVIQTLHHTALTEHVSGGGRPHAHANDARFLVSSHASIHVCSHASIRARVRRAPQHTAARSSLCAPRCVGAVTHIALRSLPADCSCAKLASLR